MVSCLTHTSTLGDGYFYLHFTDEETRNTETFEVSLKHSLFQAVSYSSSPEETTSVFSKSSFFTLPFSYVMSSLPLGGILSEGKALLGVNFEFIPLQGTVRSKVGQRD